MTDDARDVEHDLSIASIRTERGDEILVAIVNRAGRRELSVREWSRAADGSMKPREDGVHLPIAAVSRLARALQVARAALASRP